jgi:hypothetical protein
MTLRTDALKKLSISIIDFKSFKRKFELTPVGSTKANWNDALKRHFYYVHSVTSIIGEKHQ